MTNREAFTPAPVGKFMFEGLGQRWHHVRQGEAQFTEPRLPMVKLYAEETVRKLLADRDADKKQISEQRDYIDALENRLKQVTGHIASLEARTLTVKPVAWMRNTNVTSFMSRFTTDESYAVAQWGSDAVALYSLPVAFIPACFTDERNLMHINERGRETSLIWSEHNSESDDIKLFRVGAAGIKLQIEGE